MTRLASFCCGFAACAATVIGVTTQTAENNSETPAAPTSGATDGSPDRISVSFTGAALDTVSGLANALGQSRGQAVKSAVRFARFVEEQRLEGCEMLLRDRNGDLYKVPRM